MMNSVIWWVGAIVCGLGTLMGVSLIAFFAIVICYGAIAIAKDKQKIEDMMISKFENEDIATNDNEVQISETHGYE